MCRTDEERLALKMLESIQPERSFDEWAEDAVLGRH